MGEAKRTLLLNTLPLTRLCPLRHRLADHGHEVAIFVAGEARELAQLELGAELHGGRARVVEDLEGGEGGLAVETLQHLGGGGRAGAMGSTCSDVVQLHCAGRKGGPLCRVLSVCVCVCVCVGGWVGRGVAIESVRAGWLAVMMVMMMLEGAVPLRVPDDGMGWSGGEGWLAAVDQARRLGLALKQGSSPRSRQWGSFGRRWAEGGRALITDQPVSHG